MRVAPLLLFVLLAACTTETIVKKTPAENGGGEPGSEENGEPTSASCTASAPASFATAKIFGTSALDFADDKLGFAYVDEKGTPTVQIAGDGAAPKKTTWPATVQHAHYGPSYITTSLGHNGDRFGFGWYTERPFADNDGVWSTMFATVGVDGKASAATEGNDDYGRSGADDMVQARSPRVMPANDGFMLAWEDRRTKEPRVFNVNLAFWGGIYARVYDANGRGAARDVQIAQPTGYSGFAGVTDGTVTMPIWVDDDGMMKATIHARPGSKFTPAEAPPASASYEAYGTSGLSAARGSDGTVLVVTTYSSKTEMVPRVGSVTLDMSGAAKSSFEEWSDVADTSLAAVTANDEGFVVAGFDEAASAVRIFFFDAKGKRTSETKLDVAPPSGTKVNALAVRAKGKRVDVAFVTAEESGPKTSATATAHRATICTD